MQVFIASDDPGISYQLREQLLASGQDCPTSHIVNLDRAIPLLSSASESAARGTAATPTTASDLVFVVLPPDLERSLNSILDIQRRIQPSQLFAVGPTTDSKTVLRAMRQGADEYLDLADLSTELTSAIERLKSRESARRSTQTIALLSPGGGTGCSTLAVNIATYLAGKMDSCVLLDLHSPFGDLASLLDLKPIHNSVDLCRNVTRIDRSLVEKSLIRHASGVSLLASPAPISDSNYLTWEGIRQVLPLVGDLAPYVVIDLGQSFPGKLAPVVESADQILLIMRLDFTSLRNTRLTVEHLEGVGVARDRIRIVANRVGRPGELSISEAKSALGMPIFHQVVDDSKNVNRANNQGTPVVKYAPSAKVSRNINELAQSLVTSTPL